jgi:hypothetical protein
VSETGVMADLRRRLRQRILKTRREYEEDMAEKTHSLFKSRAGHISNLTRIQGIEAVMCADGPYDDVLSRKDKYDEAWKKLINAHEQYFENILSKKEKEKALLSCERQKVRKLCFDGEFDQWCIVHRVDKGKLKEEVSGVSHKTKRSNNSGTLRSSGTVSSVSVKAKRVVQAQQRQLKKQHELDRKMAE